MALWSRRRAIPTSVAIVTTPPPLQPPLQPPPPAQLTTTTTTTTITSTILSRCALFFLPFLLSPLRSLVMSFVLTWTRWWERCWRNTMRKCFFIFFHERRKICSFFSPILLQFLQLEWMQHFLGCSIPWWRWCYRRICQSLLLASGRLVRSRQRMIMISMPTMPPQMNYTTFTMADTDITTRGK